MISLHVPVIDLTAYRELRPEGNAARVDPAGRDIGLRGVSGHGLPEAPIHATPKQSFHRPHAETLAFDRPVPDRVRYAGTVDRGVRVF